MINIWDQKLVEYFNTNLILDRETEEIRKKLITTVSQQKLFEAIDKDSNGFLTISEFAYAIRKLNKPFNMKYLRRMIKQYDKYGDFSLNYQDFGSFLLPKDQTEDINKKTQIDVNAANFELFIDLVLKEIEGVKILSEMAVEIKKTKEFITYEGFRAIAGTHKYITESNLKEYLIKHGIEVKDMNELAKIIYRYDKNFDGRFGYDEFKDIFSAYSFDDDDDDTINNNSNIDYISQNPERDTHNNYNLSLIKKYVLNTHLKNKLSLQSNDETKEDSNFFSSRGPLSQTQRVMHDYSFDQEMPQNAINDEEKAIKPQNSSLYISNPFKKNMSNGISLTKRAKVDKSPLDRKINASNNDLMNSNSMLNNSLTNVSFSPNRTIIMPQTSLEKKTINQASPLNDFKVKKSNDSNASANPFTSIQISNNNKTYLLDYFNEIITKELKCESLREEISKSTDINIPDLFSIFDYSNRIQISHLDFQESLKRLSIIVTLDELHLLYKQYDKDNDGYLNYREFCGMILPKNTTHALNLNKHIPPASYMQLSSDAITLVSHLFYSIFSCLKGCENMRRDNASRRDFSNVDCYEMIESKKTNSVFKSDLQHFFKANKVMMTQFEIDILMDRFDKDNDGQITFKEFVQEIAPRGIVVY